MEIRRASPFSEGWLLQEPDAIEHEPDADLYLVSVCKVRIVLVWHRRGRRSQELVVEIAQAISETSLRVDRWGRQR